MAYTFNQLQIIGYLGSAPVVKHKNDTVWVRLAVATNEFVIKNNEKTTEPHWHTVFVYGEKAKAIAEGRLNLDKGSKVIAQGPIRYSQWQDKKTGQERIGYFMKATYFDPMGSKNPDNPTTPLVQSVPDVQAAA